MSYKYAETGFHCISASANWFKHRRQIWMINLCRLYSYSAAGRAITISRNNRETNTKELNIHPYMSFHAGAKIETINQINQITAGVMNPHTLAMPNYNMSKTVNKFMASM